MKDRLLTEFLSIDEHLSKEHFLHYHNLIIAHLDKESQGYVERHHILPKSLFPQYRKERWNIVGLPARDHFLAHYHLFKMLPRNPQMTHAFWSMCNRGNENYTRDFLDQHKDEMAVWYEEARIAHATHTRNRQLTDKNPMRGLTGGKSPFYGKTRPATVCATIKQKHWSNWRKPWDHNRANKDAWALAPHAYDLWVDLNDCGYQLLEKHLKLPKQYLKTIHSHFRQGWVPKQDEDFLQWLALYTDNLS